MIGETDDLVVVDQARCRVDRQGIRQRLVGLRVRQWIQERMDMAGNCALLFCQPRDRDIVGKQAERCRRVARPD